VEIFKVVQKKYDFIFDWQEVFKQFSSYQSNQTEEIKFQKPNLEKIKLFLQKYEFSENRIDSSLQKLQQIEEKKKQKGLSDFF
jgi:hypothetical protein